MEEHGWWRCRERPVSLDGDGHGQSFMSGVTSHVAHKRIMSACAVEDDLTPKSRISRFPQRAPQIIALTASARSPNMHKH